MIESLKLITGDFYAVGVRPELTLKAVVNWNGNTPGAVYLTPNEPSPLLLLQDGGGQHSRTINLDDAGYRSGGLLTLDVVAISLDGRRSEPAVVRAAYLNPLAGPLKWLGNMSEVVDFGLLEGQWGVDFAFPSFNKKVQIPTLEGEYGVDFSFGGTFDFDFTDGSWEFLLGPTVKGKSTKRGRRPKWVLWSTSYDPWRLYIGNREIAGTVNGGVGGTYGLPDGWKYDRLLLGGKFSYEGEIWGRKLKTLLPEGFSNQLPRKLRKPFESTKIEVNGLVEVGAQLELGIEPTNGLVFKDGDISGAIGLEFVASAALASKLETEVKLGGNVDVHFGVPEPYIRGGRIEAWIGFSAKAWVFSFDNSWVIVRADYPWAVPSPGNRLPLDSG
ncbi:MAG: hypothetical protein KDL87_18175, partial [Verrucomicrobiae bacterium]|nr:hypothetical protein [Verrucomicrobiae bacterium]